MYYIFFIHLYVNGNLNCFHVLAIVNNAAMNIRVNMSFLILVLSGYIPGEELLDHMVALFLVL